MRRGKYKKFVGGVEKWRDHGDKVKKGSVEGPPHGDQGMGMKQGEGKWFSG